MPGELLYSSKILRKDQETVFPRWPSACLRPGWWKLCCCCCCCSDLQGRRGTRTKWPPQVSFVTHTQRLVFSFFKRARTRTPAAAASAVLWMFLRKRNRNPFGSWMSVEFEMFFFSLCNSNAFVEMSYRLFSLFFFLFFLEILWNFLNVFEKVVGCPQRGP